jgi:hypothetical protein
MAVRIFLKPDRAGEADIAADSEEAVHERLPREIKGRNINVINL